MLPLSIVVPIVNAREMAQACLGSLFVAMRDLGLESAVEYVVIDDASDADTDMPGLLRAARGQTPSAFMGLRARRRMHYTHSVALGMSLSRGHNVLVVSHDMIVPPAYVSTLLEVAALDPRYGVVRGRSRHVDFFPQHVLAPAVAPTSFDDVWEFAAEVARREGMNHVEDPLLIGDSFMVRRDVIERIGVFDTAFPGFLGDLDFGVRARRAGYALVCARGAWLHHEGKGFDKAQLGRQKTAPEALHASHMANVHAAYAVLRGKYPDAGLPEVYGGMVAAHWDGLARGGPAVAAPRLAINPTDVEVVAQ